MQNNKMLIFLLITSGLLIKVRAYSKTEPAITISVNAIAGLQYDVARFSVKPGSEVKLTLTNNDDMSHNLVITQPGAREEVVNAALNLGDQGLLMNFVPRSSKVLWAIAIVSPGETKSITFTAPEQSGVYPYVCTYPGHGFVMYGAMYVTNEPMPPIGTDQNISVDRRTEEAGRGTAIDKPAGDDHGNNIHGGMESQMVHPYRLTAPYLYRVFIADAGPAAIAVNLPHELSYCWDAGTCRLRYAWQGKFLDNTDFWKGHKDADAKIMGEIFYRDKTAFPLRIGNSENIPSVKFKGYQLIKRYPQFHYFLNDVEVYELILPKEDGTGLIRTFKISKTNQDVWFTRAPDDGVDYTTSKGELIKGKIKLSSGRSGSFSIIMTKKDEVK